MVNFKDFESEKRFNDLQDINKFTGFKDGAFKYELGKYQASLLVNCIKKQKEAINKAIEYIRSNYIEVLKYDDIPSETTSYEIVTVDLLKILEGVE